MKKCSPRSRKYWYFIIRASKSKYIKFKTCERIVQNQYSHFIFLNEYTSVPHTYIFIIYKAETGKIEQCLAHFILWCAVLWRIWCAIFKMFAACAQQVVSLCLWLCQCQYLCLCLRTVPLNERTFYEVPHQERDQLLLANVDKVKARTLAASTWNWQ